MIYFDTAYVLKCYINEPGSAAVRSLLFRHQSAACCILGRLEFTTAIKRAVRERRLDARVLDTVFEIFERDDQNGIWGWLPCTPQLVEVTLRATRNLPESIYIRSADALHIVCARENGFAEIYSNDRHVLAAAPHLGIQAVNVI
jgi:predicted nucleic acid-binding protein